MPFLPVFLADTPCFYVRYFLVFLADTPAEMADTSWLSGPMRQAFVWLALFSAPFLYLKFFLTAQQIPCAFMLDVRSFWPVSVPLKPRSFPKPFAY